MEVTNVLTCDKTRKTKTTMSILGRIVVLLVGMHFVYASPMVAQEKETRLVNREYKIKAAYLFHFSTLVEWPADSLPDDGSFVIGIVGQDPLVKSLETIRGKVTESAGQRTMAIEYYATPSEINPKCQILFVTESAIPAMDQIADKIRGTNVLTVGDHPGFATKMGAIEFEKQGNNIRFQINNSLAKRIGLKISSRLLRVAIGVR